MIPDNVEKIIMTKEDYDRNVEQLLYEKIELQLRIVKAIEYIENDLQSFLYSVEYKTLLNILRGDE